MGDAGIVVGVLVILAILGFPTISRTLRRW